MGFDIKDIIKIGTGVAGQFVPGAGGKILDIVNKSIDDQGDPGNAAGLQHLAKQIEDLVTVAQDQERRLRAVEAKLGL